MFNYTKYLPESKIEEVKTLHESVKTAIAQAISFNEALVDDVSYMIKPRAIDIPQDTPLSHLSLFPTPGDLLINYEIPMPGEAPRVHFDDFKYPYKTSRSTKLVADDPLEDHLVEVFTIPELEATGLANEYEPSPLEVLDWPKLELMHVADIHQSEPSPEFMLQIEHQQPIDTLPAPYNDSNWWQTKAEGLGLATNEPIVNAVNFKRMQQCYDHAALELIRAMEHGKGDVSSYRIRSMVTVQREAIYGVEDRPAFSDIDSVMSLVICNIYIRLSNEPSDTAPRETEVARLFWEWFMDIGMSDFEEYVGIADGGGTEMEEF